MEHFSSDTMERPSKRPRLSPTNDSPPEETADWDLHAARAQNDLNLKSIFEGIFSKYSRDFTEEGDEIDLQTGEIIVDNGHLLGLQEEDEGTDETAQAWLHEAAREEEDGLDTIAADTQRQDVYEDQSEGSDREDTGAPMLEDADVGFSSDLEPVDPDSRKRGQNHEIRQDILEELDKIVAPADPLWQAPDLPAFSTPTAKTRRDQGPPKLPNLQREPSPPGSGSLWAIPKRGRPATEGKPRATPSKTRPRAKRKHHSSPVAYDWSFASTLDGDDSDDPLQELQPSPSVLTLKSKNMHGTPLQSRTRIDSPLSRKSLPVPSERTSPEIPHDQSATYTIHDQENFAEQKDHAQSHVASTKPYSLNDSTLSRTVGPSPDITPGKSRRPLTLSELKLLVRMRYLDQKKWKDISDQFPNRAFQSLVGAYQRHWRDRCANPPQLSAPWSQAELEALHRLNDQADVSWAQVKDIIPHRTQAEIEFEILCLCVGDKVWAGEQGTPGHDEDDAEDQEVLAPRLSDNTTNADDTDDDPFVYKKLSDIRKLSREDDDPFTTLGSSDTEGSKLSKIHLDSPAISRHGHSPRHSPAKQLNFIS